MSIGLYIHVPFCIKKCNYCSFFSMCGDDEHKEKYIGTVLSSLKHWSNTLGDTSVDTVYFGGGTPSVLGTQGLTKILDGVTNSFQLAKDCEITTEINPTTQKTLDFHELHTAGFNRISMGMQSAVQDELNALGRLHSNDDVLFSVDKLNRAGITNYSLDVMLGIPLQTEESLIETLEFALNTDACHISTYMLKIEENTPFYYNKEGYVFPDEDKQADLYETTSKFLCKKGFRHYEISNFCKDDKISRHNMKYWELNDYLGIGPSAHSLIGNKRFFYSDSVSDFENNITTFESMGKTAEEYLMLSLRTDIGFRFAKYKELFGTSASADLIAEAKVLEKLGFVTVTDESIKLTERGYLLSNAVIGKLLNKGI